MFKYLIIFTLCFSFYSKSFASPNSTIYVKAGVSNDFFKYPFKAITSIQNLYNLPSIAYETANTGVGIREQKYNTGYDLSASYYPAEKTWKFDSAYLLYSQPTKNSYYLGAGPSFFSINNKKIFSKDNFSLNTLLGKQVFQGILTHFIQIEAPFKIKKSWKKPLQKPEVVFLNYGIGF